MIVFFINNSIIVLLYSVQGQESTSGGRNPGPFHRRATDRGKEIFIWIYLFVSSKPTTDVLRQRADTGVPARDTTCHNLGWHFIPYLTNCMQEQCTWGKRLSVLSLHYCQWVDLECDWHVFLLSVVMTTHHTVLGSQCGVLFTCLVNGPLTFLSFRSSFP